MWLVRIITMLVLISSGICQLTQCSAYVQKLIDDILDLKITSIPTPSLMYSGITTNNAGQLTQCLYSNYSYFLVFTKNSPQTQTFTGICVPKQCTAADIEIGLQYFRPKVYDFNDLHVRDMVSLVGGAILLFWGFLVFGCSLVQYFRQPVLNQYLEKFQFRLSYSNQSGSADHPSIQSFSEIRDSEISYYNYYQGYKRIFNVPNKNTPLSLILFLSVLGFCIGQQYSYRQNIAQNVVQSVQILDSYWGILICNIEISLHTIMFVLGFMLTQNFCKISKFTKIGRIFFQIILRKWLNLILMSLLTYCFLTVCTNQPLVKLWHLNNGKDCPYYIWQIWFLFRNLQLDCKICLPWFTLLEADLLFTILAIPLVLILRTNKKIGYTLLVILLGLSGLFSYEILKNQDILFQPAKLMNGQKQYWIDYQGNSFVRMAPYFLGFIFGFISIEATAKNQSKPCSQARIANLLNNPFCQWVISLFGLALMVISYILIRPYLNLQNTNKCPFLYMIGAPFAFTLGLGLLTTSSHMCKSTILSRILCSTLGSPRWTHLQKMSLNFYALFPMIAGYSVFSSQNSIKYGIRTVIVYLIGDLFFTYFLSILVTASVENQLVPIVSWVKRKILGKETRYSGVMVQFD